MVGLTDLRLHDVDNDIICLSRTCFIADCKKARILRSDYDVNSSDDDEEKIHTLPKGPQLYVYTYTPCDTHIYIYMYVYIYTYIYIYLYIYNSVC